MKNFIFAFVMFALISNTIFSDDHIVIVLDTSGSMEDQMRSVSKSRMQVAQESLINVLSSIPDSTKIGILTFHGWIYDLNKVDQQELKNAISRTTPGGGTPLYKYVAIGATRLLKERESQSNIGSYKLLVVTDGEANDGNLNEESVYDDGSKKPGVLQDVLNRGIVVDAIGLDIPQNHALSTQINGIYMKGDDPTSLNKAIKNSLAEVGFGSSKDASDAAFKEISELPESFVVSSLQGLTKFSNHPIGQNPVLAVSSSEAPVNLTAQNINSNTQDNSAILWIVTSVFSVISVIAIIGSFARNY